MSRNSQTDSEPFFSVIVNCRNSERYLRDCLESIHRQSFSDFEVVVWDNLSTDRTPEIVREFERKDSRFKLHTGHESLNLGAARNRALHKSSGRFLAFLDSDDLWDFDFLEQHHRALSDFNEISFGIGNVQEISENFNLSLAPKELSQNAFSLPPISIFRKLLKGNCIYFSSLVIPRYFFVTEAEFRDDFVQAEDYELLLRLAKKLPCHTAGLAFYRIHPGNATNNQEEDLYRESIEILNCYQKWLPARIHRLAAIGKYYRFLKPLNNRERTERVMLTGATQIEIALARVGLEFTEKLKVFVLKGKM